MYGPLVVIFAALCCNKKLVNIKCDLIAITCLKNTGFLVTSLEHITAFVKHLIVCNLCRAVQCDKWSTHINSCTPQNKYCLTTLLVELSVQCLSPQGVTINCPGWDAWQRIGEVGATRTGGALHRSRFSQSSGT